MQLTTTAAPVEVGKPARLDIQLDGTDTAATYTFLFPDDERPSGSANPLVRADQDGNVVVAMRKGVNYWLDVLFDTAGDYQLAYEKTTGDSAKSGGKAPASGARSTREAECITIHVFPVAPPVPSRVALVSEPPPDSDDAVLWDAITRVTDAMRYPNFERLIAGGGVLPQLAEGVDTAPRSGFPDWYGVDAYEQLARAARDFVGNAVDWSPGPGTSPLERARERSYVFGRRFTADVDPGIPGYPGTHGSATLPLRGVPLVELIWNYWMEEGMLVQTLNHVLARFENRRAPSGDPLGRFDLNPLQPLRNLLWGFAEDERRRLTVRRRAAEYEYQYGLRLIGRAIPAASTVVERRTQFLEAFHNLLNSVHKFYKEHDDKTVEADAFPLLSGLREVHLLLAHGAHNQFADLAPTARSEMLAMQWILSRQEMRLFLGGPPMVPYEEPWMDRVDTMKEVQGWADASITHFFDLAVHGERLVLSVRHGRWNSTDHTRKDAEHWALLFRESVQRYVHAYRAVTGADLTAGADATMPSVLLARRLRARRTRA